MPSNLIISYSRSDKEQGHISQLVERIKGNFEAFAGRPQIAGSFNLRIFNVLFPGALDSD